MSEKEDEVKTDSEGQGAASASEKSSGDSTDESQNGSDSSDGKDEVTSDGVEKLKLERDKILAQVQGLRLEKRSLSSPDETVAATKEVVKESTGSNDSQVKAAEKRAIRKFVEKFPQYAEDADWNQLKTMYVNRRGSDLWEDIVEDFEDAHFLLNKESIVKEAASSGMNKAAVQMFSATRADIGGTSSSADSQVSKDSTKLSDEEQKIFDRMVSVDPLMTEDKFIKRKQSLLR